jgi:hypothetical protein
MNGKKIDACRPMVVNRRRKETNTKTKTCVDNIKTNSREMRWGGVDWIVLASVRICEGIA